MGWALLGCISSCGGFKAEDTGVAGVRRAAGVGDRTLSRALDALRTGVSSRSATEDSSGVALACTQQVNTEPLAAVAAARGGEHGTLATLLARRADRRRVTGDMAREAPKAWCFEDLMLFTEQRRAE